ncbi:hypothetical protein EIM50_25405 [Pseudoxanthomonas sp. SGD-10]|nr:hypothetical protein EIM50_25405 [Pseudoxanthomonas sp. SGD-10]
MSPQEFIKEHISAIVKKFSFLNFSYYCDDVDGTHFILVSPSVFFEQFDDEFVTIQNKVILEFIQLYPTQGLAFVGDEDLFEGEKPLFVIGSCESTVT